MADEKLDVTEVEEELTADKLLSGDRPSTYVFGLAGADSLRKTGIAIFMIDVLGQVRLMPPSSVKVLSRPRVEDEDLHALEEGQAINLLVAQGDTEDEILAYLIRRKSKNITTQGL